MNEGKNRLLECTEITAEAKVNTGKHAVPYVAAKILTSCENYTIIGSEQTNHWLCDKLDDNSHNQTKPSRDKDCIAKCKFGTLWLSGTDVLSTKCRDSREHRGWHQKQEADYLLNNADGGGIDQTTLVCNDGNNNKCNLNQTILAGDWDSDL